MKMSEAFPSKYLKADDDIPEDGITVTIKDVDLEKIGDDSKIVITFKGMAKGLVCNKTNAKVIAKLYGDDTDDWAGQRITLYATDVEFQGDMVRGIRVKTRKPADKAAEKAATQAQKDAAHAAAVLGDDEEADIPF